MGVWSFLPCFIWPSAGVLKKRDSFAQMSVRIHAIRSRAASRVIRRKNTSPGMVDSNMTRPWTTREHLVYRSQLLGFSIQYEAGYAAALFPLKLFDFIHGKDIFAIWSQRQKRRHVGLSG